MNNELNKLEYLLNKSLDGLLSEDEQKEFDNLSNSSKEYREEWQSIKKIKEVTNNMKFKKPPEEFWDNYWLGIYSKLERGIAWILISIGTVVVLTYAGFRAIENVIQDPTLAWFLKVAIIAILAGVVILIISVIRERIFLRKKDKYKEIIR